jgi:hypothetical protein
VNPIGFWRCPQANELRLGSSIGRDQYLLAVCGPLQELREVRFRCAYRGYHRSVECSHP